MRVASYVKQKDGTWGLRLDGALPEIGEVVVAKSRDGREKRVVVTCVMWHGTARNGEVSNLVRFERFEARGGCGAPGCIAEGSCDVCYKN
jgi:hypothetical protein